MRHRQGRTLAGAVLAATAMVVLPLAAPAQASDVSIQNWHEFVSIDGPILTDGPAAFDPGTDGGRGAALVVFAPTTNGELMMRSRDAGYNWLDWEVFATGAVGTPSVASTTVANDATEVYYRTPDNRIAMGGAIRWSNGNWTRGDLRADMGGNVTSGPAAAKGRPNRTDVFARGTNGQLQHAWRENGQVSGWEELGGLEIVGSPSVVSWKYGNRIDVFATGVDQHLWHKWWTAEGGWSGWENLGGTLTSGPSALRFHETRLDVFAKGANDSLVHQWWDGSTGWSTWEDLGGKFQYAPGASQRRSYPITVAVAGMNGQTELTWWG